MPRTDKTHVTFYVDGEEWRAVFKHEHARNPWHPLIVPSDKGSVKLTHVTTCLLGKVGDYGLSAGDAKCSVKDDYDWRKGVKMSFERALYVRGITRQGDRAKYGRFMGEFFKEMKQR